MATWTLTDNTGTSYEYDTSDTTEVQRVSSNGYVTVITYRNRNSSYTESDYDRQMRQKWEDQEYWEQYFERIERQEEFRELFAIERRIKRKVNIPILPQNVIKKTMQRRMMNGRR